MYVYYNRVSVELGLLQAFLKCASVLILPHFINTIGLHGNTNAISLERKQRTPHQILNIRIAPQIEFV